MKLRITTLIVVIALFAGISSAATPDIEKNTVERSISLKNTVNCGEAGEFLCNRIRKSELVDVIASEADISKADAKRALDTFANNVNAETKKGDRVALVGFGSLSASREGNGGLDIGIKTKTRIMMTDSGDTYSYHIVPVDVAMRESDIYAVLNFNGGGETLVGRKGRNPQTGKEIKIPAKKVVKFKPGSEPADKVK